eukprot:7275290-Pyramimonas_sp.AAC.3
MWFRHESSCAHEESKEAFLANTESANAGAHSCTLSWALRVSLFIRAHLRRAVWRAVNMTAALGRKSPTVGCGWAEVSNRWMRVGGSVPPSVRMSYPHPTIELL